MFVIFMIQQLAWWLHAKFLFKFLFLLSVSFNSLQFLSQVFERVAYVPQLRHQSTNFLIEIDQLMFD